MDSMNPYGKFIKRVDLKTDDLMKLEPREPIQCVAAWGREHEFQDLINKHFYKGAEKPLKTLAVDILENDKLGFKNDTEYLGFRFLAWLRAYLVETMLYASRFDNESGESLKSFFEKNRGYLDITQEGDIPLDGLYEQNKVYFKPGEEIGFDLDTFLNLYHGLNLKACDNPGQSLFVYHFLRDILCGSENLATLYDDFINGLREQRYALDNDFLKIMFFAVYGYEYRGVFPYSEAEVNDLFDRCLREDQKIDFEFLALACNNFRLDEGAENKLLEHFDFDGYYCDFPAEGGLGRALGLICNYLKALKNENSALLNEVLDKMRLQLDIISGEIRNIKSVNEEQDHIEKVKSQLLHIIEVLPCDKPKKDEIKNLIYKPLKLSVWESVLEVIKAIGEIISILQFTEGLNRFRRLSDKTGLSYSIYEINKVRAEVKPRENKSKRGQHRL